VFEKQSTGLIDKCKLTRTTYYYWLGLNNEGLFRKPGSCSRLKMLREALNRGEDVSRLLAVGPFSAHDCASMLKVFLSELPEPLLSDRHFPVHSLAVGMTDTVHCTVLM